MTYQVIGVGTDIVEVHRIARLIEHGGERFLNRWFTPAEVGYCRSKQRPALHFAARMAAKEATLKSVRLHWARIPWLEMEVSHDEQGAPLLRLRLEMLQRASTAGVDELKLSMSHSDSYAIATVLALGRDC